MRAWRNESTAARLVLAVLYLAVVLVAGGLNFRIWRAQHPQAPTWTYFVDGHNSRPTSAGVRR